MPANFTITNLEKNKITISNLDLLAPLLFTVHYYTNASSNSFSPQPTYPIAPTMVIAPGASTVVDLIKDNVYKVIFADTIVVIDDVNTVSVVEYLFIVDSNLRTCRKKYIKAILCPSSDPCLNPCIATYDYLRFKVLENNVYFIWNKWVQTQSVTDLIAPPDNELLSESEWLTMLSTYCDTCFDADGNCISDAINTKLNCGCN